MSIQLSPARQQSHPSRWKHRLPGVALALVGAAIATYLALYQLNVFMHVWEPFFGNGTDKLLHSSIARLLPVPDASVGAAGYLFEAVAGAAGGCRRWRTAPWVVLVYGLTIAAFAAGSVVLLLSQPLVFHAGCTLCLASALLSLTIAAFFWREPLASLRYVRQLHHQGRSTWQALRGKGCEG